MPLPLARTGASGIIDLAATGMTEQVETDIPHGTMASPPGIPTPGQFQFLAPAQGPDEIGRLGPYRVLGTLGFGGMGAVFRAEDPTLQREIALKVMLPEYACDPDSTARFLREARAQAKIQHEHVVAIFQVGEDRGVPYLAMPLLKGMTLQAALKANARPPIPEVLRIGREIAEGLAAAHEQGLIHRDIKPANIWLEGKRLRVRILDFGIARITGPDGSPRTQLTGKGMVLGTPAYMSPEQARNQPLDGRSDLFSLGIILYEMCTGVQPFQGESLVDLLTALATEEPKSPLEVVPGLPPLLSVLVMRLLSKKAVGRPQSAEQLATEIRAIEMSLGMTGAISSPTPSAIARLPVGPDPFDASTPTDKNTEFSLVESPEVPTALPVSGPNATVPREPKPEREPAPKRRSGRVSPEVKRDFPLWPIVIGVLIALAGILWGLVIRLSSTPPTTEPDKQAEVVKPVTPKPKPPTPTPTPAVDPDRAAALKMLEIGGKIRILESSEELSRVAELPPGAVRLTDVNLLGNKLATDANLAPLKGCPHLRRVTLQLTPITDAALAYFADAPELYSLDVCGTSVTEAGFKLMKNCPSLHTIWAANTGFSDANIAQFAPNLRWLNLWNTKVTDEGLQTLKQCKELESLEISRSKVSEAKVKELHEAVPKSKIQWDGGTLEPSKN